MFELYQSTKNKEHVIKLVYGDFRDFVLFKMYLIKQIILNR